MTETTLQVEANAAGTGAQLGLPQFRVKKIMKEDPDVEKVSADAVFCVTAATEIFVEYLTQHAYQYTKRDKRKTMAYRDVVNAVLEVEQFDFLQDVIPQSMPAKQIREDQAAAEAKKKHKVSKVAVPENNQPAATATEGADNDAEEANGDHAAEEQVGEDQVEETPIATE